MNHLSVKIAIDDVPALLERLAQHFKLERHPVELEEVDFVYITKDEKIKLRDNDAAFDRPGVKSFIREWLNDSDTLHRDSRVSFETDISAGLFEETKQKLGMVTYQITKHRRVYQFVSHLALKIYVDAKVDVIHANDRRFQPSHGFIEFQLLYDDEQHKEKQTCFLNDLIHALELYEQPVEAKSYGDMVKS